MVVPNCFCGNLMISLKSSAIYGRVTKKLSRQCKKLGLVTARHYEFRDVIANLARKAFIPKHVRDDPKIYTGRAVRGGEDNLKGSPSKDEGDLKG